MAAIVDWHFDYPLPIETFLLAVYNKFQITISSNSGTVYHHKYRIHLSHGTNEMIKDVEPIDGEISLNPFETVREWLTVADPVAFIRIEIGEVYADAEEDPPTFRGYDVLKDIQFYNGYDYTEVVNYVNPGFEIRPSESEQIIIVPTIKGDWLTFDKIGENDERLLGGFSTIGKSGVFANDYRYDIKGIKGEFYNIGGTLISSFDTPLSPDPYTLVNYNIGPAGITYPTNWHTLRVWWDYEQTSGSSRPFNPFHKAYFIKEQCPTYKYDRFRLRWFNRYGTFEYQNFWMKSKYTMRWEEGKELLTDGIGKPELIRVGKSGTTEYELNSDWLSEYEQLALREMYESPCVTMFDGNNTEYDVIILDNRYEISDIKDGLFKVKVRLKLARFNKARLQ